MPITVSVCCLVYNHEPYLRQCFEGFLLQQTDFEYEVLVHDDASTDNSAQIIREYAARYPDIFKPTYQTENQYSKNVCITATWQYPYAKGRYIAICEGDDYWTDPLKLQKQVDFLGRNSRYSMVCSDRYELTPDGQMHEYRYPKRIFRLKDILMGVIPATQTMLFRNYDDLSDFVLRHHFYSGDRLLAYFCATKGDIHCMHEFTAVYRKSGSGVWSSLSPEEKNERKISALYEFHKTINFPRRQIFADALIAQYVSIAWQNGEFGLSLLKRIYRSTKGMISKKECLIGILKVGSQQIISKFYK